MPVITVASDSFEQGADIARRTAQALGYAYLDRALLDQVAQEQAVPRDELVKALDEPPGLLTLRSRRRQKLLTHIQAACLEKLQADNLVCYGLGAHLYARGVAHVLHVRIVTDQQKRATELAQRENMPVDKALKQIQRQDEGRRRWSQECFNLDETSPELYDLVISLSNLEPAKAVEIIADTAGYPKFQAMTYSRKYLMDKTLAARVREKLQEYFPDVRVEASDATVVVQLQSLKRDQRKKQEKVRELAGQVPGVEYTEVHIIKDFFGQAAESGR